METTTETSVIDRKQALTELGFSMVASAPRGAVHDGNGKDGWPCIEYTITLAFKGQTVLATTYSLGVGHVKPRVKMNFTQQTAARFTADEEHLIETWNRKPSAQFVDKRLWSDTAAKLARIQKVTPQLDDVIHSLLSDGETWFNAETFEEWASNLGYDTDSRKAEGIFQACREIGRQIARSVPKEAREAAQEIVQDL